MAERCWQVVAAREGISLPYQTNSGASSPAEDTQDAVIAPEFYSGAIFVYAFQTQGTLMAVQTLGKSERLKSRKQIELLFSKGKKIHLQSIRVYYRWDFVKKGSLQAGFGVSARYFKKAVDRNRIKRQLREAWRTQKSSLRDMVKGRDESLDVFIIYSAKELPGYEELKTQVALFLTRFQSGINEGK